MFDFCFSYVVCDCSVATSIFLLWILTCNLLQLEQVRDNKHTLSAVFCVLSQLFTLLIVTTKVLRLHRIILWVPMNHGHIIILYRNVKPQRCCSFVECYCYEHLRRLKAKWKMPSHKDTKTRIRKKVFFFFVALLYDERICERLWQLGKACVWKLYESRGWQKNAGCDNRVAQLKLSRETWLPVSLTLAHLNDDRSEISYLLDSSKAVELYISFNTENKHRIVKHVRIRHNSNTVSRFANSIWKVDIQVANQELDCTARLWEFLTFQFNHRHNWWMSFTWNTHISLEHQPSDDRGDLRIKITNDTPDQVL